MISAETEGLIPGMSVTMAFVVGQYGKKNLGVDQAISGHMMPEEGFGELPAFPREWQLTFATYIVLPVDNVSATRTGNFTASSFRLATRESMSNEALTRCSALHGTQLHTSKLLRNDRRRFKNHLIPFTELPKTSPSLKIRSQRYKEIPM